MFTHKNCVLLCESPDGLEDFCGTVFQGNLGVVMFNKFSKTVQCKMTMYVCGDVKLLLGAKPDLDKVEQIHVIGEISSNWSLGEGYDVITLGEVPINVHNVGVFFRKLFNDEKNYYDLITKEHSFQKLKLSNKPGTAFRKGIYLTPVEFVDGPEPVSKFRVLRCSTNLDGPTDNFRKTDVEIVKKVNALSRVFFEGGAELNHVLAQTYHNVKGDEESKTKERKATIKAHSDKTKDMPENGLMAFCSFYEGYNGSFYERKFESQSFDFTYGKGNTVLTRLRFRLKGEASKHFDGLVKNFDIILYPNSVFLMSLHMNRLYTHEIAPSQLPADKLPTRLGYVIRCSNTEALHEKGQTFVACHDEQKTFRRLEPPTEEGLKELSNLYFLENTTIQKVDYVDKFFFSMNSGDYQMPIH